MSVRVTLRCGWCGREAEDCRGEIDLSAARLRLVAAGSGLRLAHGWPVCSHCGGPMLVEDWHPLDRQSPHLPTEHPTQPVSEQQGLAAA
jgi:hypothetical protein